MNAHHIHHRRRGQGLVEFALILPVLLFVVMGIIDFGRAMIVYSQGSAALRNAARHAVIWGGAAADNHRYLECGDGESIKELAEQVMFANVTSQIIYAKKGYILQRDDFSDEGENTITCAEAKANPGALQTGDMLVIGTTGSFNPITPLISNILPTITFQFRAQRTIITNLQVGETLSTGGTGIVNCRIGATQTEVSVRASRPTSVREGDTAIFTFSLCQPSTQTVTVDYTVTGTASPSDYSGIATSGTLTFQPGQQIIQIPVYIIEDDVQEDESETLIVTLSNPVNAVLGDPASAGILILNDDPSGLCSAFEVHAAYRNWSALQFKVKNVGPHNVDYSSLRFYYYFTRTTTDAVGATNVKQGGDNVDLTATTHMLTDNTGYLEISITTPGVLEGSSGKMASGHLQIFEGHSYNLNIDDDYSGVGVPKNTVAAAVFNIPLTVSGTVVCGEHPSGSGGANPGGGGNKPTVSISPGSATAAEGSSIDLTFSLSEASTTDVTIQYSFTGTATSSDYSPSATPATITIPAGQTSAKLTLSIIDDEEEEGDETVTVSLDKVTTGNANIHFANNMAKITIPANDQMPTVSISPGTATVHEGNSIVLVVSLPGAAARNVMVEYSVSGTASPSDYSLPGTGTIMIPLGQTSATLNLSIIEDGEPEDDETVIVTLTGVSSKNARISTTNKSATITIPANDQPPSVNVSADRTSVTEGETVRFTATLSKAQSEAVTVAYSTGGGTATPGSHYVATSGTFTFNPGEISKSVDVTTFDNTLVDGNRTFGFALSSPDGAVLGMPSSASVTIIDDDIPAVTILAGQTNVNEGDTTQFTVQLSQPSTQPVQVNYAFTGNATFTSDYTINPSLNSTGTITFNPGETSKQYAVAIVDDSLSEGPETIIVTLSNPTNAVLGSTTSVQFTIAASDPPTVSISDAGEVLEGSYAEFSVSLSQPSTATIKVWFEVHPIGSTMPGVDYEVPSTFGPLIFSPNSTEPKLIRIRVLTDNDADDGEQFQVTLSSPENAVLGRATAYATIRDVPPPPSDLKTEIKFSEQNAVNQQEMKMYVRVVNNGSSHVPLSELRYRYYFDREGTVNLVYTTWYAQNTSDWTDITSSVHGNLTYGQEGKNSYVEISFSSAAGSLKPGANATVQMNIRTGDWSNILDETNDYSYGTGSNIAPMVWTEWPRVPLYRNGRLIFGQEPEDV